MGGLPSPLEAEPGGQVGPVAVGDVGVVLEEDGDLLVGVEADAAGHQHRPVLVAPQLDVVSAPQQLLVHPARPDAASDRTRTGTGTGRPPPAGIVRRRRRRPFPPRPRP